MSTDTIAIPTAMRLAFERAWAASKTPYRGLAAVVKESLKRRRGVSYRKRMWHIERARG